MGTKNTSSTAFLNKLWKLVNDPVTDDLIRWSLTGKSFIITDQTRFTQELVPKYFKHNNMQSFIRQLNLYGFRKLTSLDSGSLSPDKGEIEFFHPNFIRGQVELIEQIKRKSQNSRVLTASEGNQSLKDILMELHKVKLNQESMKTQIGELKKENDMLWRQYSTVRMKFSKQQKVIEKLVRFMLTMMDRRKHILSKKKLHLALEDGSDSSSAALAGRNPLKLKYESKPLLSITGPEEHAGAVIHEVTNNDDSLTLDKIFQSYPDSIPLVGETLDTESNNPLDAQNSSFTFPKMEPNETNIFDDLEMGREEYFNTSNSVPSSFITTTYVPSITAAPTVTTANRRKFDQIHNDTLFEKDYIDPFKVIINKDLPLNSFSETGGVTVRSPNGTVIQNSSQYESPEHSPYEATIRDTSPPLSPDIMNMVDPSLVNPNIIVPVTKAESQYKHHQQQNEAVFKKPSPSNIGSKIIYVNHPVKGGGGVGGNVSSKEVFLPPNKQRHFKGKNSNVTENFADDFVLENNDLLNVSLSSYQEPNNSITYSSPGKNEGTLSVQNYYSVVPSSQRQRPVKCVTTEVNSLPNSNSVTNVLTSNSDSDNLNNQENNSANYKVSLPSRSLSRDDLEHHIDEVQCTLDSLKERLQSGNINFDTSTLLSLLGESEEPFIPMSMSGPSNSNNLGNEISLYNPNYLNDEDDIDHGINFASLIDDVEDEDEEKSFDFPNKKLKPAVGELVSTEEGFETPQPHQTTFNFRNN